MIYPDLVRSREIAPGNHRHGNPPYALRPGGASWCAGQPFSCWVRAGSTHLLHNTRHGEAVSWCKPGRREAMACIQEQSRTGLFPGLREAPTEVSWAGGMMGGTGLGKSSAVQNTGLPQWSLVWFYWHHLLPASPAVWLLPGATHAGCPLSPWMCFPGFFAILDMKPDRNLLEIILCWWADGDMEHL